MRKHLIVFSVFFSGMAVQANFLPTWFVRDLKEKRDFEMLANDLFAIIETNRLINTLPPGYMGLLEGYKNGLEELYQQALAADSNEDFLRITNFMSYIVGALNSIHCEVVIKKCESTRKHHFYEELIQGDTMNEEKGLLPFSVKDACSL